MDFLTQVLLVLVGFVLVFSPATLVDNVHLGVAPTWRDFLLAIPIGMLAYTGIETISNMAEEAKDETKTIPIAINRVRIAVFAIYFTLPAIALSALPCQRAPTASTHDAARPDRGGGRLRGRPDPRRRQADRPRRAADGRRGLRRPARRHDPLPRHERGAASASRGSSTRWASTASCPTGCAGCTPATARRGSGSCSSRGSRRHAAARAGGLPRQSLRLRRAALVHVAHASVARLRAKRSDVARPYRGPGNVPSAATTRRSSRSWAAPSRSSRSSSIRRST